MALFFTLSSKETRDLLGDLESLAGPCICGPKEVSPEGAKACAFCRTCKLSLQSISRGAVSVLSARGARLRRTPAAWATGARPAQEPAGHDLEAKLWCSHATVEDRQRQSKESQELDICLSS